MTDAVAKSEILVIDDEVQIRRLLRVTLETAGYQVREAESGTLGIGEVTFRRPDAIILDLGLPDLSGQQVRRTVAFLAAVSVEGKAGGG